MARGGYREGSGRKKLPPEKKAPPISKVVYFRLENELYFEIEHIAKEKGLSIGQYTKNILLENIKK